MPFADRLEGVAAVATGGAAKGLDLLRRASAGFAALRVAWEKARTDLLLAEADPEGSANAAAAAAETFDRLGCRRDAARARALLGGSVGPAKLG